MSSSETTTILNNVRSWKQKELVCLWSYECKSTIAWKYKAMSNLFYRNASSQIEDICPPGHLNQELKACPQKRKDWSLYSPCSYSDILDNKSTESLLSDIL